MVPLTPARLRVATALALASAGCLPNGKSDVRKDARDAAVTPASFTAPGPGPGPEGGRTLVARRTRLSVATLSRPAKDPAVNEALWSVADEGMIPPEVRAALEANGLRVGLIRGCLPAEVEGALNPPPPAEKVGVVEVDQPDGEPYLIDLAATERPITLLLSRDGRASGKDYQDAKGLLRVTASRDDLGAIRVKLVPEVHHGPVQQGYGAAATGPYQPKELVMKRGQAEESLRDLAATVAVRPGQVLVVGGRGDSARGLGGFLFDKAEPGGDRSEQRVVLIWAQPGTGLARTEAASTGQKFRMFQARDDSADLPKPARP